jgi:hypothetical protein
MFMCIIFLYHAVSFTEMKEWAAVRVADVWDITTKGHYEKACPVCNTYNECGKSWCDNNLTMSVQADHVLKQDCWDFFAVIILLQYCNEYCYLEQLLSYCHLALEILISVYALFYVTLLAHSLPCPLLVSFLCLHRTNSWFTAWTVSHLFLCAGRMTVLRCTPVFAVQHPAGHRLRWFCSRISQLHFMGPVLWEVCCGFLGDLSLEQAQTVWMGEVLMYLWNE